MTTQPRPDATSATLLLRRARIWAAPDAEIAPPRDVLIDGARIATIGTVLSAPPGTPEFDLGGRILTAGFWNCHVHLTEPVWGRVRLGATDEVQAALDDMLLARGFAHAIDLSSSPRTTNALIRRIGDGEVRGPHLKTAGTGIWPRRGIPYYIKGDVPWFLRALLPTPSTGVAARLAVAIKARRGSHVIKLFTGSYATEQRVRIMSRSAAHAAVEAAHRRGMPVFAHPSSTEGAALAIDAGVDALAHVPDRADGVGPVLEAAADRGIRIVPTLHMFAATVGTEPAYLEPIYAGLRGFRAAGGRVLFGTDVGYLRDRDTRGEFEAMARCGMTAHDILDALTREPAAFFREKRSGRVEVGAAADLTVIDTDALPTPADFARVRAVIVDGRVAWSADG